MATHDTTLFGSLLDFAGREDPDGKYAQVIELLAEENEILSDMVFRPTNGKTTHRTTQRILLPTPSRRRIDQGVAPTKSQTRQVEDKTTRIESRSKTDEMHLEIEGENFNAYRLSEDLAHIEGNKQQVASDIFYGNTATDPESINGLATRYNSPSSGEWADQVLDIGGTGADNGSIWKICHGEHTFHGIFPKNTKAGIDIEDLGKRTVQDDDGNDYEAYVSKVKQSYGISVRDPRSIARAGSIDISVLTSDLDGSTTNVLDIFSQLDTATGYKFMGSVKPCYYTNRTIYSMLHRQALNKSTTHLTISDAQTGGKKELQFLGVPIRRVDALTEAEAAV